jgi:Ca2+/Na+ antiporter
MTKIGFPEIIIIIIAGIVLVNIALFSITKLIKSKLPDNHKIRWAFTMIIFQIIGLIAFLIYHDFYLQPDLRARLKE